MMALRLSTDEWLKGRHFDHEGIVKCVRWQLQYKLACHGIVEMIVEFPISMARDTILRGCNAKRRRLRIAGVALPVVWRFVAG